MAYTREIYKINEDGSRAYSGYAKFDNDGNFAGTAGGYGRNGNGVSGVQLRILTAAARGRLRNPAF